jgi:site-specific DNA recombinase
MASSRRNNVSRAWEHPTKGWAAAYGRVSEIRLDINQDSPENQERLYRQGALLHKLKIKPGYEFADHGKSASKAIERRDLERAIKAVVRQEVEALVVPTVDRLSRLGMRHVGEMLDAVEAARGRIIFVKEGLDSSQPASRAIIAFLAEQARAEASNLSWRIETWHEGCRLKGKWAGKPPYGYLVIDGKLTPHPDEAPIVRQIVADYLGGQSLRQIAATLNDGDLPAPAASKASRMLAEGREPKKTITTWWSTSAVRRVLANPAMVGWQKHNGRIVLGADGEPVSFGEGILTPGEHARVLAEIERRTAIVRKSPTMTREAGAKTGGGRPARYLLVGIARCKACKYAMCGHPPNGHNKSPYLKCSSLIHGQPCPAPSYISTTKADEEVMRQLRTRLAALEPGDPILDAIAERWLDLSMPEGEGERAVLQSRLDTVRGRIVDLEEARYVRGEFISADDVGRWDQMMTRLKVQRDAVHKELEELGPPPDFDLSTLRSMYSHDVWEATPFVQRCNQLQIAVAKVTVASAHKNAQIPARERVRVFLFGEESEDHD